ncbi:hypothetical protein [Amaricoccus tamworthensis]|uniref:hypothetical protein n=1 Tax=Amaricoccus tamworthensis TaxID=57002 RepID=UPI003C7CA555
MLQEKKSETDGEKRKVLLQRIMEDLSRESPEFYYQSTSEVARLVHAQIDSGRLNADERKLLEPLTIRDIEVLLSLH